MLVTSLPHHEVDAPVFGQARVVVDASNFKTVDWHEAGIALSVRDLAESLEAIGRHVDALHAGTCIARATI